jgi:conjugal transfer/entry exclusion protein
MPHRYSSTNRWFACLAAGALTIVTAGSVQAGTATGAATEWTQLANNAQLVDDLMKSSGIRVDNQLTRSASLQSRSRTS